MGGGVMPPPPHTSKETPKKSTQIRVKQTRATKVITPVLWCMMLFLNIFDDVIPGLNLPMDSNFLYILNVLS